MLKGIAASEGIGIGKIVTISQQKITYEQKPVIGVHKEIDRLHEAIDTFVTKTEALAEKMEQSVNAKDAKIIRGHITMLNDPFMISQMEDQIKNDICAEAAAENVLNMFRDIFAAAEDELTQQRATDVEDIKTRLLKILLGIEDRDLKDLPAGTVLVVEDLTPSMTAELNKDNIAAIVTESGGMTSHSAILSRALEIPAVLSVTGAVGTLKEDSYVIVDGIDGVVVTAPTVDELAAYEEKRDAFLKDKAQLKAFVGKPTMTADGVSKEVFCNVGNPKDGIQARDKDGEGVGLFRTEFLFMDRETMPDEDEQYEAYKKVADTLAGKTVIIRTLDVGGDKEIPYMGLPKEENPFLGYRAVRYCLHNPELYKVQLKALVRANADCGEHIWIMVPMITSVGEFRQVRSLVEEICQETGLPMPRIGTMIETPAAYIMAEVLAKYCDFFSIGTNDLTQYIMAADRGNSDVAYLYNTYDPAVLRSLKGIINAGTEAGIPVGMCGEAAADPMLIPLLISFGLEEFSVSPTSVLKTRREISLWSCSEADAVAEKALSLETAEEVEDYLKSVRK
ncbi:phosphoenolpyruvate--protein phosphotransferase [Eubacterium sp. AB3007]|uniref:phosphoenolpyruvate--protein phosphotransferase n=1 Tax=Eubacterium sp. AB3007 TaxID=1392487 RepID=UPI00048120DF|nr:phosphoenolpyruvate--protein phosphotransferase [Eubacterium sp. AB3007]